MGSHCGIPERLATAIMVLPGGHGNCLSPFSRAVRSAMPSPIPSSLPSPSRLARWPGDRTVHRHHKHHRYLIRESTNRKGAYTLSLMLQERVIHVRVSSDPGSTMLFLGEVHMASTPTFKSLVELVQHYRTNMVAVECQTELKFAAKEIQRMVRLCLGVRVDAAPPSSLLPPCC